MLYGNERERMTETRSTIPDKLDNENAMRRP